MKITKENIVDYLLTLQLTIAGYQITYDEIVEQYETYQKLNPNWRWFDNYFQTEEQQAQWFKEANPIVRKVFKCSKSRAHGMLRLFNFNKGLTIKKTNKL